MANLGRFRTAARPRRVATRGGGVLGGNSDEEHSTGEDWAIGDEAIRQQQDGGGTEPGDKAVRAETRQGRATEGGQGRARGMGCIGERERGVDSRKPNQTLILIFVTMARCKLTKKRTIT